MKATLTKARSKLGPIELLALGGALWAVGTAVIAARTLGHHAPTHAGYILLFNFPILGTCALIMYTLTVGLALSGKRLNNPAARHQNTSPAEVTGNVVVALITGYLWITAGSLLYPLEYSGLSWDPTGHDRDQIQGQLGALNIGVVVLYVVIVTAGLLATRPHAPNTTRPTCLCA